MADTSLFDKHCKAGFKTFNVDGLSCFTPADWQEFIALAFKIDWLVTFYSEKQNADKYPAIAEEFDHVHASVAGEFWQSLDADPEGNGKSLSRELQEALYRLGVPLGRSITGAGGAAGNLEANLERCLAGASSGMKEKFHLGLHAAVLNSANSQSSWDIAQGLIQFSQRLGHSFSPDEVGQIKEAVQSAPFIPEDPRVLKQAFSAYRL